MDLLQAIQERHSVREYTDRRIEEEKRQRLNELIRECNEESGLHVRIGYDNPDGFVSKLAHYGSFRNPVISIAGRGPYTKIDLGIVKYHFEMASGHKVK